MRPPSVKISAVVKPAATAGSHQACTSAFISSFSEGGKVGFTGARSSIRSILRSRGESAGRAVSTTVSIIC